MQQGHGYSPRFVADVTDDMIATEKKNPDVWDLHAKFDGKDGDGRFANDPVDGALEVMQSSATLTTCWPLFRKASARR
ncbi:hypothetical protein [Streptomyces malaysiense]|uniref:Uncharacterized protein n=1 Tax=Streptomyces malaysiense TaxID=1428626 RepID=A0A1J4Q0Q2_9ACTN|nr:hypothetical protein [Streptomyces malaysiense]OIK26723.1 hypothetical protein VT52_014615 [Streptomyces malaysiense]